MIDAMELEAVLKECMFREEELEKGPDGEQQILAPARFGEGVMVTVFGFHEQRLMGHRETIIGWLKQLPEGFFADSEGKGGSFLGACETRDGVQWGEHRNMEQLFALSNALGLSRFLVARFLWNMLPGGMPYIVIDLENDLYNYAKYNNFKLDGKL